MAVSAVRPPTAGIAARFAAYLGAIGRGLPASFRRHGWLVSMIVVYFGAGLAVSIHIGAPLATSIDLYLTTYVALIPAMTLALVLGHAIWIMVALRPKRPLSKLLQDLRTDLATPERIANALPPLLSLLFFGGTFTLMKAVIPLLHPFAWDPAFELWDRWLHGGVAPWELLQPVFGAPVLTYAISWGYSLWFFLLSFTWVWQAFSKRHPRLRMQFFYTVIASWVLLGNVAAVIFSSAGPCYFGRVTGLADPFAPLMAGLAEAGESFTIWSLAAQEILWNNYIHRAYTLGAGISAMPSMHVAMATVFVLVGWRSARWIGIGMTAFLVVILIGSVHLGWHYAIDGYAGALGAAAIWWAAGRIARRTAPGQPSSESADARAGS